MTGADLLHYREIPVLPTRRVNISGSYADGGPVWPDGDRQLAVRHLRNGRPNDRLMAPCPPGLLARADRIDRPCLWGGFVQFHFGHLAAEHLSRIVAGLAARPDDDMLFTLPPGARPADVPGYFWALVQWFGLDRDRVRLVTRPVVVRDLRVAPQAEPLRGPRPDPAWLAQLDALPAARALVPQPNRLLYVGRTGMAGRGKGGNAGEAYLVERLKAAGAAVLDPGAVPLAEQMALYAGAQRLVFAEGSALHGRQLLGHRPQEIAVLVRRPGTKLARQALAARCDRLRYVPATGRMATPVRWRGAPLPSHALSFYDLPAVFDAFAGWGIDLAAGWDDAAFAAARDADIRAWMAAVTRSRPVARQMAALAPVFAAEGLGDPRDWAAPLTPARIWRDIDRIGRIGRERLWALRHPGWPVL